MRELEYILIPSSGHCYGLQKALAEPKQFERVEGCPFPRARLNKGESNGYADLRPYDHSPGNDVFLAPDMLEELGLRMWAQRDELSDLDADISDAILSTWIGGARDPMDMVTIQISDLLESLGLKRKKGGQGRRGGFEMEQQKIIWRCVFRLRDVWIDLGQVSVTETHPRSGKRRRERKAIASPALILDDVQYDRALDGTVNIDSFLVRPGSAIARFLFGPGRQAALLSSQALRYHPRRQRIEKRLTRLLAWHWRVGAKKGDFVRTYRVRTLFEELDLEIDRRNPGRTRDRFETALDRLRRDKVVAEWQYWDRWQEESLPAQRWLPTWLDSRVEIEAPEIIKDAYKSLQQRSPKQETKSASSLGVHVKQKRKETDMSQMAAAQELSISQSHLAQIENGGRRPSRKLKNQIEAWLGA